MFLRHVANPGRADELLDFIPGLSAHRVCDLPEGIIFRPLKSGFSLFHFMAQQVSCAAIAVVFNTFHGLDPSVDAALAAALPDTRPLGPIHLLAPPIHEPDPHLCLPWLDRHGSATVVYVGFGTVTTPSPAEMAGLAEGLEASGAPFIWSLKEAARELLPPGFLVRTKERGLVVSWAPQRGVLGHVAAGAFVTHCGWNSVLEGITAGVPMVCRPFFGDQKLNARAVSHVWRIGEVFEGGVATKEGTVRALEVVLRGEEGKRMRERVGELKAMAVQAVGSGGSSRANFNRLLKIIHRN